MLNDSLKKKGQKTWTHLGMVKTQSLLALEKKKKSREVVGYELHRPFPVQSSSFLYHIICGHVEVELPNLSLPGKLA